MDHPHRIPTLHRLCILIALPLGMMLSSQTDLCAADGGLDSGTLVQEALRAELDGNPERRATYLASALAEDPNDSAARWQSGFIKQDDRWMPVERSTALNASDEVLDQYRFLRDRQSGNLVGEISLARWCRANDLEDRELFHWRNVIGLDGTNAEACTRLKLRNFRGRLMTKEQIDAFKKASNDYQRALRTWGPRLSQLRREIDASPAGQESDAWQQVAAISDPDAVPAMEKMLLRVDESLQHHLINTMGNINEQGCSDVLVRLSLNSKNSVLRQLAAENLANHSMYAYAPQYLERLESPIEYVNTLNSLGDSVISHTRMRQERPDDAINVIQSTSAGLTIINAPDFRETVAYRRMVATEMARQRLKMARTVQAVEQKNAQVRLANERVFSALRASTGQELGDVPKLWWDWWKQYNEYLVPDNKKEYHLTSTEYRQGVVRRLPPVRRFECFPAGTLVHTEIGKQAIETIRPGDRVLSQDSETGELSYRVVTEKTVRPPSETMQIEVAGELITATLGHPFWVVGKGWTMAKDLNPGDRLHGISGSKPIDVIEGGVKSEAHNLIVDTTNAYFVGEAGFLVHDNRIRAATSVPVPGWKRGI
jgi:hypothetical protein